MPAAGNARHEAKVAYVGFDLSGTQNFDEFWSALFLPDGRLLVTGDAQVTGAQYDIGIARLNATDGTADPLFGIGIGGRVALNVAPERSPLIARGPDGKIWYAAVQTQPVAVLGRLQENGSVDNTFDLGDAGSSRLPSSSTRPTTSKRPRCSCRCPTARRCWSPQ